MKDDKAKKLKDVEPVQELPKMAYRYVCHGCTNDALVSSNQMVGVAVTCMHCGLQQIAKPENWLPL